MKFGVIGGAGCLYAGEGLCQETEVDWTFVCPSLTLDPDGPCTGDYLTRCDRHILYNEDGDSYASYDDLAEAMTDFGEKGLFKRRLVTVASRRGHILHT